MWKSALESMSLKFLYGKSEIGVREGLILEGEVPPLGVEGFEAVS